MKWIKSLFYLLLLGAGLHLFMRMIGLSWADLYDLPSLLFVCMGWLLTLAVYPLSEMLQAWMQALELGDTEQSPQLSLQIFSALGRYGLLAGGIAALLGVVQALGNLDQVSALGAALALSLLGLLYALSVRFLIFLPLMQNLQRQIQSEEGF